VFPGDRFASGNVLTNDLDPDPNPGLHVTSVSGVGPGNFVTGNYGSVLVSDDGSWTYFLDDSDPDTNALHQDEAAFDTFTYTVEDAQGASSAATLTVAITGTNDAPFAFRPFLSSTEDTTTIGGLFAIDPEGDTLTFGVAAFPAHGTLDLNPDGSSYVYVPAQNYSGGDSFQYFVSDGHGGVSVESVDISVSAVADMPTLTVPDGGDRAFSVNHDTGFDHTSAPGITALDDGGFVVTWEEKAGGDRLDIWAQRFDPAGQALSTFRVDTSDSPRYESHPVVAQLAGGDLAFVWHSFNPNTGMRDVLGRVFDANGAPLTGEHALDTTDPAILQAGTIQTLLPEIAAHGDGFVATWTAYHAVDVSAGIWFSEVHGQLLDANALPIGEQFQIT
jgi:VCBS repeat-containing protein